MLACGLPGTATASRRGGVHAVRQGERCSQALERARLYDREHAIAEILERGLLPAELLVVEGIEMASRFTAAGEGIMVGGDFYDVVGQGDRMALLCIGDVAGKGPAAASLAGLARHSFRLATDRTRSAGRILSMLNDDVRRHRDAEAPEFLTACCVSVEPRLDGASCASPPAATPRR